MIPFALSSVLSCTRQVIQIISLISPHLCPETLAIKTQTYLQVLVFIIHRKSLYLVKLKCLQELLTKSYHTTPLISALSSLSTINYLTQQKGAEYCSILGRHWRKILFLNSKMLHNDNFQFQLGTVSLRAAIFERYIIHSNPLFAHFVVLFKFSSLIIWKHSGYEFFSSQSIFAWSKLVNWNLRTSMEWYKKCILFYSSLQSFLGKHKTFMGSLTSMQYFHVD